MGSDTVASGGFTTAMGYGTTASGDFSTALGYYASAEGLYSTAIGYAASAKADSCIALGDYNVGAGKPGKRAVTEPILELGNGTAAKRHNALTVLRNGNLGIGTATPEYLLQVDGGKATELTAGGYLVLGPTNKANLSFDQNDIMARKNGATAPLNLQRSGGDVKVGGVVVHSSDRRLKDHIQALPYGLAELLALRPVSYEYLSQPGVTSLGFIAQELQPVLPELVVTGDDGMLSVNYAGVTPVVVVAVQQLANENNELVHTTQELARENQSLALANGGLSREVETLRSSMDAQQVELRELRAAVAELRELVQSTSSANAKVVLPRH